MEKNKTGKYLKYAFGEIILVVIGILIAISINNWNEHRKERIKEQTILIQLKEDYQSNLAQLEQKIEMRKSIMLYANKILKTIDNPNEANRDSLITYFANVGNDPTFDPIQNDLNNSEYRRLISNKKLKRMLSNWTSDIVAVKESESVWARMVFQHVLPTFMSLGVSRDLVDDYWINNNPRMIYLLDEGSYTKETPIGKSKSGASLTEITSNRNIESIASYAISYNRTANLQSNTLHERITEILNLIENEIE